MNLKDVIAQAEKEATEHFVNCRVHDDTDIRWVKSFISTYTKDLLQSVVNDIVNIIQNSKATFFVGEGTKSRIPTDVYLSELKAEICTNCELYFSKLINENEKKK